MLRYGNLDARSLATISSFLSHFQQNLSKISSELLKSNTPNDPPTTRISWKSKWANLSLGIHLIKGINYKLLEDENSSKQLE